MAKNKSNRDRKQSQAEPARQTARPAVREREELAPQLSPADVVSRKRQKRFGHN
ncbi:hypothetical protein [Streptomyces ziwulingensis]|uniref:Small hydrophilic protein n=1 Tax=Streptomyces ziwulingensis TaxID=1045501 RepID=A0ABP9CPI2_9ACTN